MILISILGLAFAQPSFLDLQDRYPLLYEKRIAIQPRPTRAGHLRFVGSDLEDPQWTALYLHRYRNLSESTEVRRALLDLMYRCNQRLPSEVWDTFEEEPPRIRESIVEMSTYSSSIFEMASQDSDPTVQAALIRVIAKSPQSPSNFIVESLKSEDLVVLREAARAAHQRSRKDAVPLLSGLLTHEDPQLILRALFALSKLDPRHAKEMVRTHNLDQSTHHNIAHFAASLL